MITTAKNSTLKSKSPFNNLFLDTTEVERYSSSQVERETEGEDTTFTSISRERELMGHYLMLLASLEHHLHAARNHQNTLNELVDLVDFSKT